jgi:hypothetical protein
MDGNSRLERGLNGLLSLITELSLRLSCNFNTAQTDRQSSICTSLIRYCLLNLNKPSRRCAACTLSRALRCSTCTLTFIIMKGIWFLFYSVVQYRTILDVKKQLSAIDEIFLRARHFS